jgi:hypothetical protein
VNVDVVQYLDFEALTHSVLVPYTCIPLTITGISHLSSHKIKPSLSQHISSAMASILRWARAAFFRRAPSPPLRFPTTGFELISDV